MVQCRHTCCVLIPETTESVYVLCLDSGSGVFEGQLCHHTSVKASLKAAFCRMHHYCLSWPPKILCTQKRRKEERKRENGVA